MVLVVVAVIIAVVEPVMVLVLVVVIVVAVVVNFDLLLNGKKVAYMITKSAALRFARERKGLRVEEHTSPCANPLGALAARRLEPRGSVAGFTGDRLCRRPPRMNRVLLARVCSSFSLFLVSVF